MLTPEYIENAIKTESADFHAIAARLLPGIDPDDLPPFDATILRAMHAADGLVTESGELLDMLKKHLFYGKDFDRVNVIEELGDLFWYQAILCHALGIDPSQVMEKNIAKLKSRFGDKFNTEGALDRNLDREREILEEG